MTSTRIRTLPPLAALATALLAGLPLAAHADPVLEWSRIVSETPIGPPPIAGRVVAMASLSVHDALNAIDPRYESYGTIPAAPAGASPDAAVATATRDILVSQVPAQAATVNAKYAAFMATLGPCPAQHPNCIADGVQVGANAAAALIQMRQNDGSSTPDLPYTTAPGIGVYQPTPGVAAPRFEGIQYERTFGINSASQFRADWNAVMDVRSESYTRNYNEVKSVGNALVRGNAPNSAQSDIARFWAGGAYDWHANARIIATGKSMDSWERARLFALVDMGQIDTLISVFDTKYQYRFWRPVTAIRWANDGNPGTASDAAWTPFLATPPYPDYTCGLPNGAGAGAEVLRRFFGTDAVPFTVTVNAAQVPLPAPFPGPLPAKQITRSFTTLTQAANESVDARVYSGIHFRVGCTQAVKQGAKVGRFVYQHWLRPL